MPHATQTPPNHKAFFFPDALRRAAPELLAAAALLWIFHGVPGILRHQVRSIGPNLRALRTEGHWRVPPSKAGELKGMAGAITWIRRNIPPERSLFYLGRMSRGIRLRYYTFPRTGVWHYVYERADAWEGAEAMRQAAPAFVAIDWIAEMKKLPLPESWITRYDDGLIRIYEVPGHVEQ